MTLRNISLLQGVAYLESFEVGLYGILIHNQCIAQSRCQLAHAQFGEAGWSFDLEQ